MYDVTVKYCCFYIFIIKAEEKCNRVKCTCTFDNRTGPFSSFFFFFSVFFCHSIIVISQQFACVIVQCCHVVSSPSHHSS